MELPLGPWHPDQPPAWRPVRNQPLIVTKAENVIPSAGGYRPMKSFTPYSNSATATRVQGAWSGFNSAAASRTFIGDATKLYWLDSDRDWEDVTGASGPYNTTEFDFWEFDLLGSDLVATNYNDPPQTVDIDAFTTGTNFADLGGSPPDMKHIARVKQFLMAGYINDPSDGELPTAVQWSAIGNAADWPTIGSSDAATKQSDRQNLSTGDVIMRVIGGEYAVILTKTGIHRGDYAGAPIVFDFNPIEGARGCLASMGVVSFGQDVFYPSPDGFYHFNGAGVRPIGGERIDRYFLSQLIASQAHRIVASIDPVNKIVMWAFPGPGSDGTPNRALIYHWHLDQWTYGNLSVDFLARGRTVGLTLEQLDAFGDLDSLPYSLDSPVWTGGAINLAAFNQADGLLYFDGPNLAATIETAEVQISAGRKRTLVQSLWPMTDAANMTVNVGTRDLPTEAVTWAGATPMDEYGKCDFDLDARYHRFRNSVAAAEPWTYAQSVKLDAVETGEF